MGGRMVVPATPRVRGLDHKSGVTTHLNGARYLKP